MKFWLGTHHATSRWFGLGVPLFVSRRTLTARRTFPVAAGEWALDSGGFTELNLYGEWRTTESEYVADVERFYAEIDNLAWVAPMDWMCEPFVLEKTGLSLAEHQERTVDNFVRLRERLGQLVIPVLQGWSRGDYLRCADLYEQAGVSLATEALVGVGSVCRRQDTSEAARIFRSLEPLKLHGFGVKVSGLSVYADALSSADSLAWSYRARMSHPLPGCTHKSCANCPRFALRWREQVLSVLGQQRLEFA